MHTPPVVLSIAGYDPSSGAGITADIKTAAACGCYAVTCITALTVQSTQGVFGVQPLDPSLVKATLQRLAEDLPLSAVRLGMLGSAGVAAAVVEFLQEQHLQNIVLDPVIRSSSGAELLDPPGQEFLRATLLPWCDLITPNVDEAAILAGTGPIPTQAPAGDLLPNLRLLAGKLHGLGCRGVVITGGHLAEVNDYLSYRREDGPVIERLFPGQKLDSRSTHGTGCAFAMAVACSLARGYELPDAVLHAKEFVLAAIESAYPLGKGVGPINHMFGIE